MIKPFNTIFITMTSDVTITPILFTSYKNEGNKHNLKIRITFNNKQKNFPTKFYFTKDQFQEIKGKKTARKKNVFTKKEREHYKAEITKLIERYREIIDNMPHFTFHLLEKEINKKKEIVNLELFALLKKEEETRRRRGAISSADQYKDSLSSLKRLLNLKEIALVDVTPELLYDYEEKALDAGNSPTTVAIYLRPVRFVFNDCIGKKLLGKEYYPFGPKKPKYKMPTPRKRKMALDTFDLEFFKKATPQGRAQFYLDLFLFSYYTFGLNVIDMIKLEKYDIYKGFIDFSRRKTKNNMKIPIREEAMEIIEKYAHESDKYVFGVLKGDESPQQLKDRTKRVTKQINKVLRSIGCESGINVKVTSYTARHTVANNLLVQDVPVAAISQLLTHKDIKTTQNYLKGLPDYDIERRVKDIDM